MLPDGLAEKSPKVGKKSQFSKKNPHKNEFILRKYIYFKITKITLAPSFEHLFATYSYTSYRRVGEFLTISDCRSNYSLKFAIFILDWYFTDENSARTKTTAVWLGESQPRVKLRRLNAILKGPTDIPFDVPHVCIDRV